MCVDDAPPHLDRPFTYAVPERLRDAVRPGLRVAVPFGGRDSAGWVLQVGGGTADTGGTARAAAGRLRAVRRVVSPLPVLDPAVARVARAAADRFGGSLADVLRTAVPPRHARAERALLDEPPPRAASAGDLAAPAADHGDPDADPGEWLRVSGGA
ncbi:MAG: hypothetical protein ACFCVG_17185, partial [Kineosporiaceae bacterium]